MSDSTTVTKRSAEQALMPPPPPPKKIKRPATALEEEEYENGISRIIKRDFFPGLAEFDQQKEYLAALVSDNPEWVAEAGQKLRAVMTPGAEGRRARADQDGSFTPVSGIYATAADTPRGWVGNTPRSEESQASRSQKGDANTDLNLEEFLARYTSEDNESFYRLLDKSNQKRGEKYSWLWANNKVPTARQVEWKAREQKQLTDAADEAAINGGKGLSIRYFDKRKAAPDAWKTKPNNTFMFAPDSVEGALETVQQRREAKSKMGPKEIVYENTRMPPAPRPGSDVPPSPSLSAVRDALAGRPRLSGSESGLNDAGTGGETPRVNGYVFVDSDEPEPHVSHSPARIDLGPGDATLNPFRIRDTGSRESLHHRMVDRLNDKKVEKAEDDIRTAQNGLTPAARRLLGRVGGLTPKAGNDLGDSWGRSPRSKPSLAGVTPIRK